MENKFERNDRRGRISCTLWSLLCHKLAKSNKCIVIIIGEICFLFVLVFFLDNCKTGAERTRDKYF